MGLGEDLREFMDELEENIPLRAPLRNVNWTDTISLPYGSCQECQKEPVRGRIRLYDLIGLIEFHEKEEDKPGLALVNFAPYLEIAACNDHLKRAIKECFLGTFEYHEDGKDALHIRAYDNVLIRVDHSDGLRYIKLSYPLHPSIDQKARFLGKIFEDIIIKIENI
ncbi:hypothetical protein KY332_02775 [Candidatus Woesearchaeota archaeon]|nr:hypothetical protein [Candidatus Woesearchaeota archaeon]